eukprot:4040785-Amphidinium_carterae.1
MIRAKAMSKVDLEAFWKEMCVDAFPSMASKLMGSSMQGTEGEGQQGDAITCASLVAQHVDHGKLHN